MIWGYTYAERKRNVWKRVYAWHPVRLLDGRWLWLEWCERSLSLLESGWIYIASEERRAADWQCLVAERTIRSGE